MTQPVVSHDNAPGLERCFWFDAVEASYDISGVTGRIPDWLRGHYYVNGPARFERAGQRYKHWLDGDGMVASLAFTHEGVRFTSRFAGTAKLREEEAAGRFLYRGFGSAFPGDRLRRKVMIEPPVNVSVYPYNGRVLAFGEQAVPLDLDPVTLETRGEYDFNGSLNEVTPFAAHAKFDGHLLNFGVSFAARPMLNTYEFDGGGRLLRRRRYPLGLPHSMHDFNFTPRRMVFFLSPLLMDFGRFWNDGVSVMESLSWEPEKGSRIMVTPREGNPDEAFTVEVTPAYCLHLINCFEDGDRLMVDLLELDEPVYREYQPVPDLFQTVAACRPVRYVVDCATRKLLERIAMDYELAPDFPSIDTARAGHRYEDFWMLGIGEATCPGRKFFNELAHGSWKAGGVNDVYRVPEGEFLGGEPAFAANPVEPGEGVVIVQHHQPALGRSSYLLFDAFAVREGPIARMPLRHKLHPGFHASFTKS